MSSLITSDTAEKVTILRRDPTAIERMYSFDESTQHERARLISEKIGSTGRLNKAKLEMLAQSDPIEYHKMFMKAEQEVDIQIAKLVKKFAKTFIEVGYTDKQAIDNALKIVKPLGEKLRDEYLDIINFKNQALTNKLNSYVSNKSTAKTSELGTIMSSAIDTKKKYDELRETIEDLEVKKVGLTDAKSLEEAEKSIGVLTAMFKSVDASKLK